ncbi:PASTA domain-containing protein [Arthrobacter sp. ISL-65]|uniref:PASTA domain-containing protein n=1 Tax=Arthrobacter sp. ISL-65 TaxID=2819112 RepID=UPI001BE5CCE0|nr:PASTA domain-containing protein [Arthrobacter sp. ISL-65]MBT2549748.1 PASTA domain-containing protein [Arthrobacter sp. ISL-65]
MAVACAALALSGCGASPQGEATASPSASRTAKPKIVPDVAGKTFTQARDELGAAGIAWESVGTDGLHFTDLPPDGAVVLSTEPQAGGEIERGSATLHLKSTRAEAEAARAKVLRALRYEFRCSPTGDAITAEDNQVFHSTREIWAAPDFKEFQSCDLYVDGTWHHDTFTLEPGEAAVVKQIGADGGDVSLPSSAYADVLLLCALPPEDGWDRKYGENPAGPKIRSQAKAAVKMCPTAPFVPELKRVADGVPPAPKSALGDGTFTVGKDIAAGTYQVKVPAAANGVHDCYWERTGPQGGTIANDFITFAPQGPVVTVYEGEGFVSRDCGSWTKIG